MSRTFWIVPRLLALSLNQGFFSVGVEQFLKSSVTGPSPPGRGEGRRKEAGEKKEEEEEKRVCVSKHHSGNSVW